MVAGYLGLFLLGFELCYQVESWQCSNCEVHYKAVGCYRDNPGRVLKTQVINERDTKSNVYNGWRIDWMDWNNYMPSFACRCARIVKERGWKVFGLQFYGECWSGPPGSYNLKNFRPSASCLADDYRKCGYFDRNCVGKQWTNFVFELGSDCDQGFERIGCFIDNKQAPRPLPDYIMTDRERRLKIFSGQSIDWRNWDVYLPEFVCRCAKLAKQKGHSTFGVQYYGECWSGKHSEMTYGKIGVSKNCIDKCFGACRPYEQFCAGRDFANSVYRLSDAPCEISYTPVGCYGEDSSNRAFTDELLNQVNPVSEKFNGIMMEYGESWQGEFKKFLCRCAREAHQKGYTMFGVYNHGECWSAKNADQRYNMHEPSEQCFQNFNQTCPQGSVACGGAYSNYVYSIAINSRRSLDEERSVPDVVDNHVRRTSDAADETDVIAEHLRHAHARQPFERKPDPFQ